MLDQLKQEVLEANLSLEKYKLVTFTWGNASGIDRDSGLIVIKPSGIPYPELSSEDLAVIDLDGNLVEGKWKPSSDAPTHQVLYDTFPNIGGVVHTHSLWGTCWAQSGKSIPVLGTTHADYFYGKIPCTRPMESAEILGDYEKETGKVITETFRDLDPDAIPGVLVNNHAPFTWGKDPMEAFHNSVVLEEVAKMALYTYQLDHQINSIDENLLDKHYLRKHGSKAYYGQS
ncbi:L-ribulose-5-phosphate 4-epimerase [Halobacillus kuroshimensis]|uniref:L-ribulose-5-phosphate 4-epimerase n=1 Tax=Halobacillus kuroshimensis TaxID=302481 RepID=UPI00040223D3|nr:L-ribulose-5-phosphate 4-epimerase [Halobacillus kuroshimensis]